MFAKSIRNFPFLVMLLTCNFTFGQSDFFWSDKGLGQGAENGDLTKVARVGEPFTLYLYYTTDGPSDAEISVGMFLDIATLGNFAILAAETLEFEIEVAGTVIDQRWRDVFGTTGIVQGSTVTDLSCFGFFGHGLIDPGGPLVDTGYDAAADAFLIAKLEMQIVEAGGCFNLSTRTGKGGIVHYEQNDVIVVRPQFGCATICDPDNVGSEPVGDCPTVDPLLGDVNLDSTVNLKDVAVFVDVLTSGNYQVEADLNRDGVVNLLDVQGFVNVLAGLCPTADPDEVIVGDANCDGCIDLLDLAKFQGFLTSSPCNFQTADVNGDGVIDLFDVQPLIDLILSQ